MSREYTEEELYMAFFRLEQKGLVKIEHDADGEMLLSLTDEIKEMLGKDLPENW